MTFKRVLFVLPLLAVPVLLSAQGKGLDPAELLKPLADSWTTYNGDYSGKRYSSADSDQPPDREEPHARLAREADRRLGEHHRRRRRRLWPRRPGAAAALR